MSTTPEPSRTRVLIIAGIRLYCESLAKALGGSVRVEVIGVAYDPVEGLHREHPLQPDVVLVDSCMPQAVVVVQEIVATAPAMKVIALAVPEEDQAVLAFAEAGVSGYVTRDATMDDLVRIIESVTRGEAPCPPRLAAILLRHIGVLATRRPMTPERRHLTHRELEVVELIDLGLSNKEIARHLCIEVATVKNHVHRILEKLQLGRRAEAAAWVRAHESHRLVGLRANRSRV